MGSLYLRGDVWWASYYRGGRQIRESTECRHGQEKLAKDFLKRREGDVASGRPVSPKASKVKVEEILDDLLTDYKANDRSSLDGVERIVTRLKAAFGHRRAHELKTDDIQRYVVDRQIAPESDEEGDEAEKGAANATINRELAALKRAFNLAVQGEKILRKPYIPMLAENNVRNGFLSEIDFLALHEALPAPLNHMLAFAYRFGWRKGELLALTWDRVDLPAGTVRLDPGTTKNREGRVVVLTDDLKALLRRLWMETRALAERKGQPIPWVFHRRGRPVKDFRGAWEAACTKVGLGGRVFHDLRRSAVRGMERRGIPRSVAMKITGHKTEAIYRRYAIVSESDLREAALKLAGEPLTDPLSITIPSTIGPESGRRDSVHHANPLD